jgi:hypothetical protein
VQAEGRKPSLAVKAPAPLRQTRIAIHFIEFIRFFLDFFLRP